MRDNTAHICDGNNIELWMTLLAMSCIVMVMGTKIYGRKKRQF